ncbi:hypothetical protein CI109_101838 [Kwoniella shandongensis]|uniref:Uncharacterized protein n=1 Tax=Kwoniella shandongensis TaxID=1734106 RepID=A0A5M6BP15_9TREE|nr:uncharacterized protein CI109_007014 [Kwoniella shandongensis]KAA5524628.1 hypothetical protein CI109_007014 [Kwoniella shandongensis]
MLHRRPTTGRESVSTSSQPPPPPPASSSPRANKTYTPLRRQSTNLYASNTPSSGPRARYNVPSPLPSPLNIGAGAGSSGGYAGYNSYGYSGGSSGGGGGGDEWIESGGRGVNGWKGFVRSSLERLGYGLKDAVRLERSWNLVWNDRELRTLVLKSTVINLVSLVLLSLSSLIFSPLLVHPISPTMETRTKEIGMWYNLLLSWPVFVMCFWINASWGPDISKRAEKMLNSSYRYQPSPTTSPSSFPSDSSQTITAFAWVFKSLARIMLISDFTLVSRLTGLIPFIGKPAGFAYMCIINAYYCFEWTFSSKQWPLDHRITYMQDRTAYMLGFGFLATFLTSFGPPLVKMAIFALIYPFFVIQALQSRPPSPSKSSLLPSTPSPHASLPPSPSGGVDLSLNDPFFASTNKSPWSLGDKFEIKLPLFWLASYALEGLRWLEVALARHLRSGNGGDYGGGGGGGGSGLGMRGIERPGKRAM